MTDVDVRFFRDPGWDADGVLLCTVRMAHPPSVGDRVFLPGRGLQRWQVELVEWDLRASKREVAVWVTAT